MSWRVASRLLIGLLMAGATTPAVALSFSSAPAGAEAPLSGFYLDLGGSASVGFQPTQAFPHGQPTPQGYSNDVVAYEAARGVTLDLSEMGCPGETTTTVISGGDTCHHVAGSQLADAMAFLRAHVGERGIVTIDLGFNDVHSCLGFGLINSACVEARMSVLEARMPFIVHSLQGAAGAGVSFVGVGFDDPYLADAMGGLAGARFASYSETVVNHLNSALSAVYASAHIPMAMVGTFFEVRDHSRVNLAGVGAVPDNVANVCELTWMCASKPYGPNMHPNNAGYLKIAAAIESQLRPPW